MFSCTLHIRRSGCCNTKELEEHLIATVAMHVNLNRILYIIFLSVLFISMSSVMKAQDMRGEFKKQFRETLLHPDMKRSEQKLSDQKHYPAQINFQNDDEVLTVSPTTILPTRVNRLININKLKYEEVNVNMNVTNVESFKIIPARSSGSDFDPVRAIYRYKARKRKEKVDKIVKAYEMD